MRRTKLVLGGLVLLASVLLIAFSAQAGEIHPDLLQELEAAKPNELVGALVMMKEQADIRSLDEYLKEIKATRKVRHEAVVTTLRDFAMESQAQILNEIYAKSLVGKADRVKPLWIINAVTLYATPDFIEELAMREDVGTIYPLYPIELIKPVSVGARQDKPRAQVEPGLVVTGAPELWAIGIDGTGVLVCNIDTGVDGNHKALKDRWRGNDPGVHHTAAWFDPVTNTNFPFDSWGHGTHTMGTITGKDGDHIIGMAPGAKWIAAGVIDRVDIPQTIQDALLAMQWTTDPDGNPSTVDDVPDVVSNSWGVPDTECDATFWQAIDNAEAAGSVYVWAAGNEGPFPRSLRWPANRITSPVNTFAVGALKQGGNAIAGFSSRGPSTCDNQTKKPEVCAVGVNVLSAIPGNQYTTMDGTSMATPHVAGAVALLRQVHPDATADEIKYALLNSCVDLGDLGEDNTYGMGRIDVVAALGELGFGEHGGVRGTVTIKETGDPLKDVDMTVNETQQKTKTAIDGKYRFLIAVPGTYIITAEHPDFGVFPKQVDVGAGSWTQLDFQLSAVPVADFTSDKTEVCIDRGEAVQFFSLSQGKITVYFWDVGDGTTYNSPSFSHVYLQAGSYSVFHYVAGPYGESNKYVADYVKAVNTPSVEFSASKTKVKVGEEIQFTDLSQGPPTSWYWDFGDGTTSEEQNPVKAYNKPGKYNVTLRVSNACDYDEKTEMNYITVVEKDEGEGGEAGCGCGF